MTNYFHNRNDSTKIRFPLKIKEALPFNIIQLSEFRNKNLRDQE